MRESWTAAGTAYKSELKVSSTRASGREQNRWQQKASSWLPDSVGWIFLELMFFWFFVWFCPSNLILEESKFSNLHWWVLSPHVIWLHSREDILSGLLGHPASQLSESLITYTQILHFKKKVEVGSRCFIYSFRSSMPFPLLHSVPSPGSASLWRKGKEDWGCWLIRKFLEKYKLLLAWVVFLVKLFAIAGLFVCFPPLSVLRALSLAGCVDDSKVITVWEVEQSCWKHWW